MPSRILDDEDYEYGTVHERKKSTKSRKRRSKRGFSKKGSQFTRRSGTGVFSSEIMEILKMDSGGSGLFMSKNALRVLDSMAVDVFVGLASDADSLRRSAKKQTLDARDIEFAAKIQGQNTQRGPNNEPLPNEVAKFMMSQIPARLKASKKGHGVKGKRIGTAKAHSLLRKMNMSPKISDSAAAALAVSVEYVIYEILKGAVEAARVTKNKIIKPKHVTLSVRTDAELRETYFPRQKTVKQSPFVSDVKLDMRTNYRKKMDAKKKKAK